MNVLIVYHSRLGSVKKMARLIARGVESVPGANAMLRQVPEIVDTSAGNNPPTQQGGDALVELSDLDNCDALIIGSPTRFGNMAAELKYFLDGSTAQWLSGALAGKPAAAFTSSSSMHGGQESTLISMMIPLLHQGMIICGLPYTEAALSKTTSGGTPYGASHVAGVNNTNPISEDEKKLCLSLGKRVARLAHKLGDQSATQ